MDTISYTRLHNEHLPQLREFCKENWGQEHPLIHNEEMFDYYYRDGNHINMVIAYIPDTDTGSIDILGVCGFIKTNMDENPDIFLSYILSKKKLHFGVSLRLIEYIKQITNARTINCNNIRKKTAAIYEFLDYTVADMDHYYRLNPEIKEYLLCSIENNHIEEIESFDIDSVEIKAVDDLVDFNFFRYKDNLPYKDMEYVGKRYLGYPFHAYMLFKVFSAAKEALLVVRKITHEATSMLRVVDFIGDRTLIKDCGHILDNLMKEQMAEYVDWYSYGIDPSDMKKAGFSKVDQGDQNTIPFYLSPPVMENILVTVFVSTSENFLMFRGDGDQDRPNLG